MVLSQIEMRSSLVPSPLASKNSKGLGVAKEISVIRYVEGESDSSEDDNVQIDVEVEMGNDEGSVEDVELGGHSEDDDERDDEVGEEEYDEEDDESVLDDFIDDEAEEYSEGEEEDESE